MMRRLSTASTLAIRLLLAPTIIVQTAALPLYANAARSSSAWALADTDAPALPSSFFGSATLDGADTVLLGAAV